MNGWTLDKLADPKADDEMSVLEAGREVLGEVPWIGFILALLLEMSLVCPACTVYHRNAERQLYFT